MRVLDLFSGIGGFSLGLERAGFETVAFCEIDPYCRKVLKKHWPEVPIFEDIRKLNGDEVDDIGLICGGYPCQPFSNAGKRAGEEDDRHLWPEMYRIIKAIRPRWSLPRMLLGTSVWASTLCYLTWKPKTTCWTFVIPACAIDAKHRRDRVWIVGNTRSTESRRLPGEQWEEIFQAGSTSKDVANAQSEQNRRSKQPEFQPDFGAGSEAVADTQSTICKRLRTKPAREQNRLADGSEVLANTTSQRQQGQGEPIKWSNKAKDGKGETNQPFSECKHSEWAVESPVGRVANGIPRRVDRLKGLGNAVVPQIPEIIGRAIMETEQW